MFVSVDSWLPILPFWTIFPGVWLFSSFVFFAAVYLASPVVAQRKLRLYPVGLLHMIFSTDNWFRRQSISKSQLQTFSRRRRIIFIRHGESVWNVLFNRGFFTRHFIPNLLRGIFDEFHLLPTADSVFLDSPLSSLGIAQALTLRAWIDSCTAEDSPLGVLLRGGGTGAEQEVTIVSSNLRRAVSTAAVALASRLLRNKTEKVVVHHSLQEITRNLDGVSITPARHSPGPSFIEKTVPELEPVVERIYRAGRIDGDGNGGQKSLLAKAIDRFREFNDFVFHGQSANTVVVVGHSLWIKEFMKNHLPTELRDSHDVCRRKLVNCGVIAFDLLLLNNNAHAVDPASLTTVYGGFETKAAASAATANGGGAGGKVGRME